VSAIHFSKPSAHVALLELDNPPMNALGRAARAALLERLDEIDTDKALRAIVLTGRGRAFCGAPSATKPDWREHNGLRHIIREKSCKVPIAKVLQVSLENFFRRDRLQVPHLVFT